MGRNDWYRRTTWSREDQEAFHQRLRRSRTSFHKAQYARIQAAYLETTGVPQLIKAALGLLDLVLAEWPEPSQLACLFHQKATCCRRLGDVDAAVKSFRKALETEERYRGYQTRARIDFVWLIATNKLESLYSEALSLWESPPDAWYLPIDQFQRCGAMALILEAQGQRTEAAHYAQYALEAASQQESGLRYHKDLGLVGTEHAAIIEHIRRLAAI